MIAVPGPGFESPGIVVGLRGGRRMVCIAIVEMLVMPPGFVFWVVSLLAGLLGWDVGLWEKEVYLLRKQSRESLPLQRF